MSEDRAPRVLMVIRLFDPWVGGTQTQAHRLARALRDRGVDVRFVTGRWFTGTPREEAIDGIRVFRHHALWGGLGIRGVRTLAGYVSILTLSWHLWRRRRCYDVLHVHGLSYHTFAAVLAGRRLGKPTIAKLANSGRASDIDKMRRSQHLPFSGWMLGTALDGDRFVALNRTVERELREAGVPAERIVRIANGIDPSPTIDDRPHPTGAATRAVFVGRLHRQKGVDVLLRAAAILRDRGVDDGFGIDLVGDGPERRELEALSSELGLAGRVRFLGNRDDVDRLLRTADLFLLPSRAEGMSNALLEAMRVGLPVVATAIPGNDEVVDHEVNGLLVPADDPASLADAIERLLGDVTLREQLGEGARRTVETTYAMPLIVERYLSLYRSLLDERMRPPADRPTADASTDRPS